MLTLLFLSTSVNWACVMDAATLALQPLRDLPNFRMDPRANITTKTNK
jgi:hypothetical protein